MVESWNEQFPTSLGKLVITCGKSMCNLANHSHESWLFMTMWLWTMENWNYPWPYLPTPTTSHPFAGQPTLGSLGRFAGQNVGRFEGIHFGLGEKKTFSMELWSWKPNKPSATVDDVEYSMVPKSCEETFPASYDHHRTLHLTWLKRSRVGSTTESDRVI